MEVLAYCRTHSLGPAETVDVAVVAVVAAAAADAVVVVDIAVE